MGALQQNQQTADEDGMGVDAGRDLDRRHWRAFLAGEIGKDMHANGESRIGGHVKVTTLVAYRRKIVKPCLATMQSRVEPVVSNGLVCERLRPSPMRTSGSTPAHSATLDIGFD